MATLDEEQKADIRHRLRTTDISLRALAAEYGVSHGTISRVAPGARTRVLPDLTGLTFGEWLVLRSVTHLYGVRGEHRHWLCLCSCGRHYPVRSSILINGLSRMCRVCQPLAAAQTRREKLRAD